MIETLVSLLVLSLVVFFSFEIFGPARRVFSKLKASQEESQAALSALDKARIDVLHAGLGLLQPVRLGLLPGLSEESGVLSMQSAVMAYLLAEDVSAGQTEIALESTEGLVSGKEICICDVAAGELGVISGVQGTSVLLAAPLSAPYLRAESSLILLERVSIYLDESNGIIRRKVNQSPSQPLLEEVAGFELRFEQGANLVTLRLRLSARKEKTYECTIYPKNTALAAGQ